MSLLLLNKIRILMIPKHLVFLFILGGSNCQNCQSLSTVTAFQHFLCTCWRLLVDMKCYSKRILLLQDGTRWKFLCDPNDAPQHPTPAEFRPLLNPRETIMHICRQHTTHKEKDIFLLFFIKTYHLLIEKH